MANATVVTGAVLQDDQEADYSDSYSPGIFTDYFISSRYEKDRHIYMMGITSPGGFQGQKAAFVQTAEHTLLNVVDWTACKVGSQPEVPNPGQEFDNWILLDDHYKTAMISVMADGITPIYSINGTYVYGCKNPSKLTPDDITYPRPPWLNDDFELNMESSTLTNDLLG